MVMLPWGRRQAPFDTGLRLFRVRSSGVRIVLFEVIKIISPETKNIAR